MLEIKRLTVGQLKTNCYLVYDRQGSEVVIIDPGDDAEYINEEVLRLGLKPICLVATHGHFDHVLAATAVKLAFSVPFGLSHKDQFLYQRAVSTAFHFTSGKADPILKTDYDLHQGDELFVGKESLKVMETPGHTPGSLTFYSKKHKFAFVGDLLFADGSTGRTDHSYGNKIQLQQSITKVRKLETDLHIYSGHGDDFIL